MNSFEAESISVQHCDELELVEPCTVETLLFTNVWRIPQVIIHKRRMDSKKLGELAILRKGSRELGYLGMNCIDVRGWAFDHNSDDQKPEGLLSTSPQAANNLDNNQHSKLSLGGSKFIVRVVQRSFQEKDVKRKALLMAPSAIERWRARRMSGRSY